MGAVKCNDLVFDVGMHRGEDTERYLAQGFRVVAVEANPALVDLATQRFAPAIASGRLTIVGAAVAEERGAVELAVFEEHTVWSSTDREFIERTWRWDSGAARSRYRPCVLSTCSLNMAFPATYVGTLANTLALRGGIGGVEGGMIGSFLAFGVNRPSRPRTISYWLPNVPA